MLNQFIPVGRLVSDPKINEITLAVTRSYKNMDGTYDTDFIPVTLMGSIAENTAAYCHDGDLIGIKGHIQSTSSVPKLIADRVTFLSSQTPTHTTTDTQDTTNDMSKGEI